MTKPTSDTRKLNFITDQGSILASTNWARRVGAFAGVRIGAGRGGAIRSVGLFLNVGATLAGGRSGRRYGRHGHLGGKRRNRGLVRRARSVAVARGVRPGRAVGRVRARGLRRGGRAVRDVRTAVSDLLPGERPFLA